MSKKEKDLVEDVPHTAQEDTLNVDDAQASSDEQNPSTDAASEINEFKDKYLRLYAEFENYKRRIAKERLELFSTANQDMMVALLPVLDDFQRALKAAETNPEGLKEGVDLIYNKLNNTLTQKGLKPVAIAAGDAFDVDVMEAITRIPAPAEALKGKVVDVIEPGYKLGERVIRYAKVVVGE